MAETTNAALGRTIRHLRKSKGLSQEQLAEATGFTRSSIANIESGRQNVGINRLRAIADALGVGIVDLLGDDGGDLALVYAAGWRDGAAHVARMMRDAADAATQVQPPSSEAGDS